MSANGISNLPFKRDRQIAKLELAKAAREGRTVAYGQLPIDINNDTTFDITKQSLGAIVPQNGWSITTAQGTGTITNVDELSMAFRITYNGPAATQDAGSSVTIISPSNSDAISFRQRNTYNLTQFPTVYAENNNNTNSVVNNPNEGGLIIGRPWIMPIISAFSSFTFTNGTQTGRTGPSIENLLAAYDTDENPWLDDITQFSVESGFQIWTVPTTGTYRITARGAQGFSANTGNNGGTGAVIQGEFALTAGEKLRILVGQAGTGVKGGSGGGGGGSFVTKYLTTLANTGNDDILIIAAGGGGTRTDVAQNGCVGRSGQLAGTGSGNSTTHNCAEKTTGLGEGGIVSSNSWGSGAGGFFTQGVSDYPADFESGQAFIQGALGGSSLQFPSDGGFGCGGSGEGRRGGGGGGGYSGGDGGRIAGGGGSFNSGANQSNISGGNESHGSVLVELL